MKTRIKNIEECRKLFKIEVPKELVEKITKEVYLEIKKVAKIPGFRPGSAPQDLLEKHYSKDAEEQVLKRIIPEGYKKALEIHSVMPAGLPRVFNVDFEKGTPLTFEAEVDTRPVIKRLNYRGIRVRKKRISVSEVEINEALSKLREMCAKYHDVARPVKKGDYAVCEVETFIDGRTVTKKNKNMWIQADKEASLLGMGEELIGLTKGQAKEIEAKLPEDYPDKKYAGKLAKFKVLVNEVKEKKLAALDDTLARSMNTESLEALKKRIESELYARKENSLKINMKNQILEKFLKEHKFSVPSGMVARQKEVLAKRLQMELLRKGVPKEETEKKVKELDSKLGQDARDKIRIYFILDDIALKEKIEINDNDIEERLKSIALSTGQPPEEVRKYYEKENLTGGLAEEIKESKVLEFLLKEAEVIEER
ncbi:MAG: trigger factor [Candidatus Omnitrophota bacterium]